MRYIRSEILSILTQKRKMAFIAGPRQVGKTTLAKSLLQEVSAQSAYYNWDIDSHRKKIIEEPGSFWSSELPLPSRVVLDEIHKYPRWKRFLKGFYDANRGTVEVLVTGSGRLDLFQRGGDSLFGRYHLFHLFPYSVGELMRENSHNTNLSPATCLHKIFDSPPNVSTSFKSLWDLNGFPEPLFSGKQKDLLQWQNDHRQLILHEDMRDLTQIRELGLVESLIQLLPERIGSLLSINALREDLNVNFRTVQNWLSVLERLFYLFVVKPYSAKLSRTLRREAKLYFYDWSELEDPAKKLENFLAVHLKKACSFWTDAGYGVFELFYVRDKEKREVDFVVCNKNKPMLLVESKMSSEQISPSLTYFQERLKPKFAFQVGLFPQENLLKQKAPNLYLCHASRFLAALP
jgi:predicted AAA+ superfamily ATPase